MHQVAGADEKAGDEGAAFDHHQPGEQHERRGEQFRPGEPEVGEQERRADRDQDREPGGPPPGQAAHQSPEGQEQHAAERDHRDPEGHESLPVIGLPPLVRGADELVPAGHQDDRGAGDPGRRAAAGEVVGREQFVAGRAVGRFAGRDQLGDEERGAAVGPALRDQRPRHRPLVEFGVGAQRPQRAGEDEPEDQGDEDQDPPLLGREEVLLPGPDQGAEHQPEHRRQDREAGDPRVDGPGRPPGDASAEEKEPEPRKREQGEADPAAAQLPEHDPGPEQQGHHQPGRGQEPDQVHHLGPDLPLVVEVPGARDEDPEYAGERGRRPEAEHHRPLAAQVESSSSRSRFFFGGLTR